MASNKLPYYQILFLWIIMPFFHKQVWLKFLLKCDSSRSFIIFLMEYYFCFECYYCFWDTFSVSLSRSNNFHHYYHFHETNFSNSVLKSSLHCACAWTWSKAFAFSIERGQYFPKYVYCRCWQIWVVKFGDISHY